MKPFFTKERRLFSKKPKTHKSGDFVCSEVIHSNSDNIENLTKLKNNIKLNKKQQFLTSPVSSKVFLSESEFLPGSKIHVDNKVYKILQQIESGGFSKIYKVLDKNHKIIALKRIDVRFKTTR